jgi:hypothetical protein
MGIPIKHPQARAVVRLLVAAIRDHAIVAVARARPVVACLTVVAIKDANAGEIAAAAAVLGA